MLSEQTSPSGSLQLIRTLVQCNKIYLSSVNLESSSMSEKRELKENSKLTKWVLPTILIKADVLTTAILDLSKEFDCGFLDLLFSTGNGCQLFWLFSITRWNCHSRHRWVLCRLLLDFYWSILLTLLQANVARLLIGHGHISQGAHLLFHFGILLILRLRVNLLSGWRKWSKMKRITYSLFLSPLSLFSILFLI